MLLENKGIWQLFGRATGLIQQTDDELMEMIKSGDQRAFEVLFDRHGGKLLGYSGRLLGDRDKAEDLSQEVWMKVIRNSKNYQSKGHFIAWLFTIARNSAFTRLKKYRDWDALDESSPEQYSHLEESTENIEDQILKGQNLEMLKLLIDGLPSTQRAVLVMSIEGELTYEEMADELDSTVSAVKSLLFRARKSLEESWGAKT